MIDVYRYLMSVRKNYFEQKHRTPQVLIPSNKYLSFRYSFITCTRFFPARQRSFFACVSCAITALFAGILHGLLQELLIGVAMKFDFSKV